MFEPIEFEDISDAVIKVVGVGGGGGNAVNHMVQEDMHGVEFYSINTDAQALRKSLVQQTIQIGGATTKGLGAGANPNVGRQAAEDDKEAIRSCLDGADMVFIAAGMGGGTGTGAAPVVAQIAKELGILTVAVVTKPFGFEGKRRMSFAEQGIKALSQHVDSLIVIPNDKLLKVLGKNISLINAFATANEILRNAVRGISELITSPGLINVDFADVRTVMQEMGNAMMGTGIGQGEAGSGRADQAAQEAVASPLLEDIDLSGARGVLVNVTSGPDLSLDEFYTIGDTVKAFADPEATIVVGSSLVPEMENEIRVTIVATGIGGMREAEEVVLVKPNTGFDNANLNSPTNNGYASGNYNNKSAVGAEAPAPKEEKDLFDVPSFLRKQAD
ncbi:cell division protein FtsZ [Pasteurellaceae bacterium TAE3-ERU1]|uniref:cell division protein FtsZ n=1 Tax=Spirabiliibacterium mucosae TaxID=28156 RepID=UPI001AACBAFC|nr:cell division protein FtsZ [Spirabiliibacterium mucosae]MBE2898024.1 cell division protein FtsZ [Spirabiliibacterium mucosae]MBV7387079.1 cell division protein FtsZ [Pasteurellaceae bacterium TAE3-ERU1]